VLYIYVELTVEPAFCVKPPLCVMLPAFTIDLPLVIKSVPLISIAPLTFMPCEKSNSSSVASQSIVASVVALTASCMVIPAPSAVELESPVE
jgi:hypothetical protein